MDPNEHASEKLTAARRSRTGSLFVFIRVHSWFRPRAIFFSLLLIASCVAARAERYLTVEQARKLAFPKGDRFKEKVLRFTREQAKEIETRSGVPVKAEGNRVFYAYQGAQLVGVLFIDHVLGKHEIIDYSVAISPEGKVLGIEILEYRESYGYEIRNPKWRKQFVGAKAGDRLRLNKDIYNISGATMSCRHVTDGTKRVLATFDLLCRPELVAGGVRAGAPGESAAH
jgi:Na+-translocating ferredoxin:NAD+ oxidoreductase RnfG subunit